MGDLVERLRSADMNSQQRVLGSRIFGEAAEEITRLRAALTARDERMKAEGAKEEREKWQRPTRDTFDAMCAMRDAINEHVPMPSLESDLLHGPENSVFCATVAESVIDAQKKAQAKITRLTEALRPFSQMAGEMFARNWDASDIAIALDNPEQSNRVYISDFFAARKAIGAEHASDCAVHNGPAYPSGSCTCGAALQENAHG